MKTAAKWDLINTETIISNKWISIHKGHYRLPNGVSINDFYTVREKNGVNIVALTERRDVLVVKQYRPAVEGFVYDFPAGFIEDDDNDPLHRAKVELLEETGYVADIWHHTGAIFPAPHRLSQTTHCFIAIDAKIASDQQTEETEAITYQAVSITHLKSQISTGGFNCGVCLSSFSLALMACERLGIQV